MLTLSLLQLEAAKYAFTARAEEHKAAEELHNKYLTQLYEQEGERDVEMQPATQGAKTVEQLCMQLADLVNAAVPQEA